VEVSMADIKKQPSPVMASVCRLGCTRWAPSAAGMDQPMAWLFVGLKKVRGWVVVKVSVAQYCDSVTSTKVKASQLLTRRSARRKAMGSTPWRQRTLALELASWHLAR